MTTPIRVGRVVAAAVALTLALSGVASANAGKRTFQQTYPLASKLCANVEAGKGPKRLRKSSAQVLADCGALQTSFTAARTAVLSTFASIASARATERASVNTACAGKLAHRASCEHARKKSRSVFDALNREHIHAARAYFAAAEAARRTFWTSIHALPGGADVHADAKIPEQND
jgi:hypothetical protein